VKHERPVAVKVLSPTLAGQCCEPDRFVREIHIAARLVHPAIIPLHDSGQADGLLYYVMPYLAGETLRDRLRREGPLPVAEVLRLTRSLAAALDYAHRQGVVHRDIKPENVLLHEGQALLADFGVAWAISEAGRPDQQTEGGLAVGTPDYMSPEQASADRQLDGRSDQYSLACMVYELLAGEPPFTGAHPRAVMAQHISECRARCGHGGRRPGAGRGAAPRPGQESAERFATCTELAEALAAPDAAVAAIAGRDVAVAVLPFVNVGNDPDAEYLSDGLTEELIHALSQVDGLRVASRTSAFAYKDAKQDVRAIGALLGVTAVLEGSVRQSGKRLRVTVRLTNVADGRSLWAERFDRELADVFAIEDEIAQTIVRTLRATLLGRVGDVMPRRYTENVRAHGLYLKGRYAWNKRSAEGVAEAMTFEQALAEDPTTRLRGPGCLAHALHVTGAAGLLTATTVRASSFAARWRRRGQAHRRSAGCCSSTTGTGPARSEHFQRHRAESDLRHGAPVHTFPLLALGRLPEALAEARLAQELDPASVAIRRAVGWAYYYARRYDEAAEHLRRAAALNPTSEETRRVSGLVGLARGDWDEAEAAFREALSLGPASAYSAGGLGAALARAGRTTEAREILAELTARRAERYVTGAVRAAARGAGGARRGLRRHRAGARREAGVDGVSAGGSAARSVAGRSAVPGVAADDASVGDRGRGAADVPRRDPRRRRRDRRPAERRRRRPDGAVRRRPLVVARHGTGSRARATPRTGAPRTVREAHPDRAAARHQETLGDRRRVLHACAAAAVPDRHGGGSRPSGPGSGSARPGGRPRGGSRVASGRHPPGRLRRRGGGGAVLREVRLSGVRPRGLQGRPARVL
jgi:serine/threonine-protein kinase